MKKIYFKIPTGILLALLIASRTGTLQAQAAEAKTLHTAAAARLAEAQAATERLAQAREAAEKATAKEAATQALKTAEEAIKKAETATTDAHTKAQEEHKTAVAHEQQLTKDHTAEQEKVKTAETELKTAGAKEEKIKEWSEKKPEELKQELEKVLEPKIKEALQKYIGTREAESLAVEKKQVANEKVNIAKEKIALKEQKVQDIQQIKTQLKSLEELQAKSLKALEPMKEATGKAKTDEKKSLFQRIKEGLGVTPEAGEKPQTTEEKIATGTKAVTDKMAKGAEIAGDIKNLADVAKEKDVKKTLESSNKLLKRIAGGSVIGLALSGIADIAMMFLDAYLPKKDKDKESPGTGTGGSENGNTSTPPIDPKPDPNDEKYNKTLADVTTLFKNFDQDFKDMLEKDTSYKSNILTFEAGKVDIDGTDVKVSIKYEMPKVVMGQPLIPGVITLSPQNLRGFALTPNDILSKMNDGDAKNLLSALIDPSASFIFIIKLIQLVNDATKNPALSSEIERTEYILDNVTELFSRFILTTEENSTPEGINSYLQKFSQLSDILNSKNVTIYKTLVNEADTDLDKQNNAFRNMPKNDLDNPGPVINAIKIFYNHFHQIYYKKFDHDDGFVKITIPASNRPIKNYLLAIFYRGIKDIMRAGQTLATTEGKITLRRLDGSEWVISPKTDLNSYVVKPAKAFADSITQIGDAIKGFKATVENKNAQPQDVEKTRSTYDNAIEEAKKALDTSAAAMIEFRKKFAPYYPITCDDGTSLTPAEFMIDKISTLNQADPNDVKLILSKIYDPFRNNIGLTEDQLKSKPVKKAAPAIIAKSTTPAIIAKPKTPVIAAKPAAPAVIAKPTVPAPTTQAAPEPKKAPTPAPKKAPAPAPKKVVVPAPVTPVPEEAASEDEAAPEATTPEDATTEEASAPDETSPSADDATPDTEVTEEQSAPEGTYPEDIVPEVAA